VQDFLGVPVDHYIKLKLKATVQIIDAVGGLTIDVEKDMKYDDNWGNLHIDLKKGLQHLDGVQAVGYSRFRHDPEGDRGRVRRQQQVLAALVKELKKPTNILKINQLARIAMENVESDLSYRQLLALAYVYKNFDRKHMGLGILNGGDENGGAYFMIPDENQKRRLVKRLLTPNPELEPDDLAIEIVNASDDKRAGTKLRDVLKAKGYGEVIVAKDAPEISPLSQLADRVNNAYAAAELEALLGIAHRDEPPERRPEADYTIIIGNDFLGRLEELVKEAKAMPPVSRVKESPTPSPDPLSPSPSPWEHMATPSETPRSAPARIEGMPRPDETPRKEEEPQGSELSPAPTAPDVRPDGSAPSAAASPVENEKSPAPPGGESSQEP